jgi:uncharacterized membrane protein SpoIIM required for sporulation
MSDRTTPITLKSSVFRQQREEGWRALEVLVEKARRRGLQSLSAEELGRLPLLYRSTVSSLSVARAIALDRNLLLYLEDLALRSFLLVYGPRRSWRAGVVHFFSRGFPAGAQAAAWHILAAFACVVAGSVAGFVLASGDEAWIATFIPADLAGGRGIASTKQDLLQNEIFAPWPGWADSFIVFASFLFQHNTMVGILCFGLGIAGGLPTAALMIFQGLTFGAFLALHANRGLLLDCVGWVSIHGVTEFGAIILCGAGGFVIGERILLPGGRSRLDSLAQAGETATRLAVGAMLLFMLAAVLEGGLRQLVASTPWRLIIGFSVGGLWISYLALRRPAPAV